MIGLEMWGGMGLAIDWRLESDQSLLELGSSGTIDFFRDRFRVASRSRETGRPTMLPR